MKALFLLAFAVSIPAFAEGLPAKQTYVLDVSGLPPKEAEEVTRMCQTELYLRPGLGFSQALMSVFFNKPASVQQIENSKTTVNGGDGLQGAYFTNVFIVKVGDVQPYPYGVYYSSAITQYGPDEDVNSFNLDNTLLNYRESAALAEDTVCDHLTYRRK